MKGVSWYRRTGRWRAQARRGRRVLHFGYFATQEDAARAYARAVYRTPQQIAAQIETAIRKGGRYGPARP